MSVHTLLRSLKTTSQTKAHMFGGGLVGQTSGRHGQPPRIHNNQRAGTQTCTPQQLLYGGVVRLPLLRPLLLRCLRRVQRDGLLRDRPMRRDGGLRRLFDGCIGGGLRPLQITTPSRSSGRGDPRARQHTHRHTTVVTEQYLGNGGLRIGVGGFGGDAGIHRGCIPGHIKKVGSQN